MRLLDIFAGEGNDFLSSGRGNDFLIGVKVESFTPGKGEWDIFQGGKGSDTFVLGDSLEVYYDDGIARSRGLSDAALILDFKIERIRCNSAAWEC